MMEVGIATTPAFQAAQPVKLFTGKFAGLGRGTTTSRPTAAAS